MPSRAGLLILLATSLSSAQQIHSSPKHSIGTEDSPAPLFALEQAEPGIGVKSEGATIDPILLLRGKHMDAIPDQCQPSPERDAFDNTYLKPGNSYTVIFGGAEAGTATIKSDEAGFVETRVELSKSTPIRGLSMALAAPGPWRIRPDCVVISLVTNAV